MRMAQSKSGRHCLIKINQVSDWNALWRSHAASLLAALAQRLRNLDLAEEALQHAFEKAARHWPATGWPGDAAGWLYRTAWNFALDQRKHAAHVAAHAALAAVDVDPAPSVQERLATFFLCAHPALSVDTQAMLMLRFAAGLSMADIARWFYSDEQTVSKRLQRAKHKIEATCIEFQLPEVDTWAERLPPVLSAIEVLYDRSYADVAGSEAIAAYGRDAEQLALTMAELLPDQPSALGLASLIVFAESRRSARLDSQGSLVPLDRQDPQSWDGVRIHVAAALLARGAATQANDPFVVRAAISAAHAERRISGRTPWRKIAALYELLFATTAHAPARWHQLLALAHAGQAVEALEKWNALRDTASDAAYHLIAADIHHSNGHTAERRAHLSAALRYPLGSAERQWVAGQLARA